MWFEILGFIGAFAFSLMIVFLVGKIGKNDGAENVPDGKEVKMMIRTENECVGCRDMGMPCMGSSCPNRNVKRLYCDNCKEEVDELHDVYGDELCNDCFMDCIFDYFPKITAEDADD